MLNDCWRWIEAERQPGLADEEGTNDWLGHVKYALS